MFSDARAGYRVGIPLEFAFFAFELLTRAHLFIQPLMIYLRGRREASKFDNPAGDACAHKMLLRQQHTGKS